MKTNKYQVDAPANLNLPSVLVETENAKTARQKAVELFRKGETRGFVSRDELTVVPVMVQPVENRGKANRTVNRKRS